MARVNINKKVGERNNLCLKVKKETNYDKALEAIKTHSRFKFHGDMVEKTSGLEYRNVVEYNKKLYYSVHGLENNGSYHLIFNLIKCQINEMEIAEHFPYYINEIKHIKGRDESVTRYRSIDDARVAWNEMPEERQNLSLNNMGM